MKIRILPELWFLHNILPDSEKERWLKDKPAPEGSEKKKTLRSCAKHTEYDKVGNEDRLAKEAFGGVKYQIHQTEVNMHHQPTKVTKTTSTMELLLIERLLMPTNVINYLRPIHQPQRIHGQTDHGINQIHHGKVIGNFTAGGTLAKLMGPMKIPQLVMATSTQKDYSHETAGHKGHYWWTSWLTPHSGRKMCQFLLLLWILYFPAWVNVLENLLLRWLTRSKSQFAAQHWLRGDWTTRLPTCIITQYLHESRIQIHPIIGQRSCRMYGTNMDLSRNWIFQPEKCNSVGTYYQVLLLLTLTIMFRSTWMGTNPQYYVRWKDHIHVHVQRHWMDKERQYGTGFAHCQRNGSILRPKPRQETGASWSPRQKICGGMQFPTNLKGQWDLVALHVVDIFKCHAFHPISPATEPLSLGQLEKRGSNIHFQDTLENKRESQDHNGKHSTLYLQSKLPVVWNWKIRYWDREQRKTKSKSISNPSSRH